MSKLLPIVRGWGWSARPTALVPFRRVEPIIEIVDKEDYEEERNFERMYLAQKVGTTYNKNGKVENVCKRPGGRVSRKV
jgi:hypothetical protein